MHVLVNAIEDYKSKAPWNTFKEIVALTDEELTTIKDIGNEQSGKNNKSTEIYDLQVHRLTKNYRGINFVRTSDGKKRKVLLK